MTSEGESTGGPLYHRLQVPPGASGDDIGRAYRRLAHGVHPDANPDDPEAARRFQELTEAYEVLSDAGRRARYDKLHAGATPRVQPIGFGPRPMSGSMPLLAGPVHVDPPMHVGPLMHVDPPLEGRGPGEELMDLLEAFFGWGRWR
jgi:molecular chaperone DnaJ